MPADPRWTSYIPEVEKYKETPLKSPAFLNGQQRPEGFEKWFATNVYRQKQAGYAVATVTLPLGDITATQTRQLANIARRFSADTLRTTVEQNIVLRWVAEADLCDLYRELKRIGLSEPGAGTILDVVACPGTDTCKLGISSSRGLGAEIRSRLAERLFTLDESVRNLRIKISGCFNSCGQHHVADLGFYGNSRTVGNRKVPHFQVVLGGKWQDNAGTYGLAIGTVPSKNVPDLIEAITTRYVKERKGTESFQDFIKRIGRQECRAMIEPFMDVPAYEKDRSYYSDWGDPREFTIGDMGTGECAGEVISVSEFDLADAERLVFEAQVQLESESYAQADALAYRAMLQAATSLVKTQFLDVKDDPKAIVSEFRRRFYDTGILGDRYAGNKFAEYLFRRHDAPPSSHTHDQAHRIVEEAQLFIEATYACHDVLRERGAVKVVGSL
jgi:ferredoxin-nitrite reductase